MPAPPADTARSRVTGWLAVAVAVAVSLGAIAAVAAFTLPRLGGADGSGPSAIAPGDAHADGFAVWDRNDDGTPVRWNPCTPIDLVVSRDGTPPDLLRDLEVDLAEAIERVNDASGLELRVVGDTDEAPSGTRLPYQPECYGERWAPVLVGFAAPGENGLALRDVDRAIAVPLAVGPDGDRTYVTGQVVLNRDRDDLRAGFEDRIDAWGSTLLHELGHLVGLDHVDDADELMATYPGAGPVRFGPGDRAGLDAVGARHGCRPIPPAGPVDVERPGAPHH